MKTTVAALAVASMIIVAPTAVAAPGTQNVVVVNPRANPVNVAVVNGAAEAVNVRMIATVTTLSAAVTLYTNAADRVVKFESVSARIFAQNSSGLDFQMVTFAVRAVGDDATLAIFLQKPVHIRCAALETNCEWVAYMPGPVIVGPGQYLRVSALGGNNSTEWSLDASASGHTLP